MLSQHGVILPNRERHMHRQPSIRIVHNTMVKLKLKHFICTVVDCVFELLFCIMCWIVISLLNHEEYYDGSGQLFVALSISNVVTFLLSISRLLRDWHFVNKGLVSETTYLSYSLFDKEHYRNIPVWSYIIRMIMSVWLCASFFTTCGIFRSYLCVLLKFSGAFPIGSWILINLYLKLTKKYKYLRREMIIEANENQSNHESPQNQALIAVKDYLTKSVPILISDKIVEQYGELECNICLDNFMLENSVRKLDCGHVFHKDCIDKWLNNKTICPTCKQNIIESVCLFPINKTSEV